MAEKLEYTLRQLADFLGAELVCAKGCDTRQVSDQVVSGLASLQTAGPTELSFLSKATFVKHLETTRAVAVLVGMDVQTASSVSLLRVKNPYLAYAQASVLFDNTPEPVQGIHPSAVIDKTARVAPSASIGANSVIEAGVVVGANTVIAAGCVIGPNAVLGEQCFINSHVTLYHGVQLGNRVLIHSGTVIGADGFGFAPKPEGGWQKIHQLGTVCIGNDVEIGANTTIDRGAIDNTVIADGVIIDNQVQIAHGVHLGKNTAIAACAAIAGSTHIGANCTIAGAVGIVGHLTIVDNVHITAMSMVTKSINEAGSYSGGTGLASTAEWRRNAVRFGQLDSIAKRLSELENK